MHFAHSPNTLSDRNIPISFLQRNVNLKKNHVTFPLMGGGGTFDNGLTYITIALTPATGLEVISAHTKAKTVNYRQLLYACT
jgi:hypothetical protein